MLRKILVLIGKTIIVATTTLIILGFGFVFSIILMIALGVGLSSAGETTEKESLNDYTYYYGKENADTTFVSVPINGVILGDNHDTDEFFSALVTEGIVYGYEVKEQLQALAKEESVDGIILEINSPGGTIYGTQAIVDGVKEYKEKTNKPVIAFVGSTAASGGYWAAASADEIIADHGTVLGSIGVIVGPFKYYDTVVSENGGLLMGGVETENGITTEYITAGKYKDLGNPYRELTDEERGILQESVNNSYQTFVSYVAEKRGISVETITNTIGGLVYDDIQAVKLGLSNATGSKDEAYLHLATKTNASEFQILQKNDADSFWSSFKQASSLFKDEPSIQGKCLFEQHSQLLAYYGDASALCLR